MTSLLLTNNVTEIAKLGPFVEQFCEAAGLDTSLSFKLQLVLDEAVSNVVNYAYGDAKDMPITINADIKDTKEGKVLCIEVIDNGIAFNPIENAPVVDTTLTAEERPIGGLGIFIIKELMDNVSYQRLEGNNILTMAIKL